VATAHLDREAVPPAVEARGDEDFGAEGEEDEDEADSPVRSMPPSPADSIVSHSGSTASHSSPAASYSSPARTDPLSGVESIRSHKSVLDRAEADVGVPAHLRSTQELRRLRASVPHGAPTESQMEAAANFPVPEYLQSRVPSPTSTIPSMTGEDRAEPDETAEEGARLPRHALYYYKWAYAFAMTPGIKASEVKKERERLVKEAKRDIDLAFDLAVKRTHEEGIEGLGGLKPGVKKITTLPLEVLENSPVQVPHAKKMLAYSRLLLSDGKHTLPLYVVPPRADGIHTGDLLSLRDAYVDYWLQSGAPAAPGASSPGEMVLLLGKNGQMIITK